MSHSFLESRFWCHLSGRERSCQRIYPARSYRNLENLKHFYQPIPMLPNDSWCNFQVAPSRGSQAHADEVTCIILSITRSHCRKFQGHGSNVEGDYTITCFSPGPSFITQPIEPLLGIYHAQLKISHDSPMKESVVFNIQKFIIWRFPIDQFWYWFYDNV